MKCKSCGEYTILEKCKCGGEIKSAHYKFIKVRDAPKSDDEFWKKMRKK